jgi:hypothetical protein
MLPLVVPYIPLAPHVYRTPKSQPYSPHRLFPLPIQFLHQQKGYQMQHRSGTRFLSNSNSFHFPFLRSKTSEAIGTLQVGACPTLPLHKDSNQIYKMGCPSTSKFFL